MADDPDTSEPNEPQPADEVHARAMSRFSPIAESTQEERMLALEDRRFASIAGAQWEGPWQDQWANSIRVEVNKTAQGVEKIIADYRANRVTVNFRAVGDEASEQTAETLNGMFRADLYASKGQEATDNAFDEGVNGGIGAWRLTNVYCDEYDPDNDDQRIAFEPIVDADQSVFWDQNSRLYDKSDARFCFVLSAMSKQAFIATYGADKQNDWPQGTVKRYYDWFTPDIVRVAEYYEVEIKPAVRLTLKHRVTDEQMKVWLKDLEADDLANLQTEGWDQVGRKKVKRRQVAKYLLSGSEVLEGRRIIAGTEIPIIPFYGKRWFIDNMERSRGHVRLAKDPQRIYNAQITNLVETSSLSPIERPIFTPEQIAGHELSWAEANINRSPYSLINPIIGPDGSPLPTGPVAMVTPPQLPPVLAALIQITASDIADLTSADDGADQTQSNVSAEAMDIAATRTDAKSGIYMDNFRQSMQRCGEVYQSMASDITVEGQEVETMEDDGGMGTATIMEPHTDEKTGAFTFRNDLSKGKYKVIADVTEATTTRRDKTVKNMVNGAQVVATFDPELASAMMNTAIYNMDGEGVQGLKDWVRARLVKQGLLKPTPEEKAELEQAQQNQPPDPDSVLAQAQATALQASAAKDQALTQKAGADTELSKAKVVQTLADAHQKNVDAEQVHVDTVHTKAKGPFGDLLGKMLPFNRKPANG